jgi:hypothetical protein
LTAAPAFFEYFLPLDFLVDIGTLLNRSTIETELEFSGLETNWGKKGPGRVRTAKRGEGVAAPDPTGSGKVYFSLFPQQSRYGLPEPHGQGELGFGLLAIMDHLHAR